MNSLHTIQSISLIGFCLVKISSFWILMKPEEFKIIFFAILQLIYPSNIDTIHVRRFSLKRKGGGINGQMDGQLFQVI